MMKSRFKKIFSKSLICSGLLWIFIITVEAQEKPNILWLVIEDTSPHFIGAYGNSVANTPVMDRLCKEGVQFQNAYATAAVCAPSRFTIITGGRTHEFGTGHHRSAYPVPAQVVGFPKYLREEGYYTTNNSKKDYNTAAAKRINKESWDDSSNKAGWWNRPEGKPFFSVFNFNDSHQSRTMTNPYENYKTRVLDKLPEQDRISPEEVILPSFYPDTPEMRREVSRIYNALTLVDHQIGDLLKRLEEDGLKEKTIIFFYSDHGEGMIRAKTNASGLGYKIPMAVIIPDSYRGGSPWKMGTHTDDLITFEDLAPTMLSIIDREQPEYMKGQAFLYNEAYIPHPYVFASVDRSGESQELSRTIMDKDYLYTRVFIPYQPEIRWQKYFDYSTTNRLMRKYLKEGTLNEFQKKLFDPRPIEFLYDVKNDIWETHNLSNDPKYIKVLEKMRVRLDRYLLKSKDVLFLPEEKLQEIAKESTPYEFRQDENRYPFSSIYETARLVQRDTTLIKQQIEALKSTDETVRLWAVTALKTQKSIPLRYAIILEQIMKAETYIPVKIELSGLCYQNFKSDMGKQTLISFSLGDDKNRTLRALQNIHYLSITKKREFLPLIRQVVKKNKATKGMDNILNLAEINLHILTGKDLIYNTFW